MQAADWRKYLCEFIGTFALVFFAAGAVMTDALIGAPGPLGAGLIAGAVVTVVIYSFGHVSGAHVNPALSLAAVLLGRLEARLLPGYVLAQLAASVLAAVSLLALLGDAGGSGATLPNRALGVHAGQAFMVEAFLSFLLMWVVCGTAFDARAPRGFAGLAIGATVGIGVALMGPVAGAAMNPARALGPGLFSHSPADLWIYLAGPVTGMVLAAGTFRLTHAPAPPREGG